MFRGFAVFAVVAAAVFAVGDTSAEAETTPSAPAFMSAASVYYDDAATLTLIASILSTAQDTMATIAGGFIAEAPGAESQAEFDAMQAEAVRQIKDTEAAAAHALRAIRNETWSDEVWEAAHAALPVLRASMVAELAVVEALEYPGPTTTTSTMPPPTTTSTVPPSSTATSTTAPPPTTTTMPAPPTTTTTIPSTTTTTTRAVPSTVATTTTTTRAVPSAVATATTTTRAPPTTTTTTSTIPAVVAPQGGGSSTETPIQRSPDPQSDQGALGALFAGAPGLGNAAATTAADPIEWLSTSLDVVFPPMIATAMLSPFIIIEVIGRTVLRSGSAIVLPILMLGFALLFFRWRDRKRDSAHPIVAEGPEVASS